MSFLFRCCPSCFYSPDESAQSSEERQPLLPAESARLSRPVAAGVTLKKGRFVPKMVGVPELDQHFADISETFNQQQGHYEGMTEALRLLGECYGRPEGNSLSQILQSIREKHNGAQVSLQMQGYDLTLLVSGEGSAGLQQAQEHVSTLAQAAKAVVAAGPRLQSVIGWVLQGEEQMVTQVRMANPSFQEQLRVESNLRENVQAARWAGELSARYRHEAGALLTEAATVSTNK
ncbi:hypothetical protein GJAV_G00107030 [Gymnothorax javanicus]|nr:hypothetical protein GJAV_G00107030 [Gymnothorax javanicus]